MFPSNTKIIPCCFSEKAILIPQRNNRLWTMVSKQKYLTITTQRHAHQAENVDDCESTSGASYYLGGCLLSWLSKKQSSVSLSTTEAEYITTTTCCDQVLWMTQTFQYLQVKFNEPILMYNDNTSAISISKKPFMHSKTKYIPIKYHFVLEQVY